MKALDSFYSKGQGRREARCKECVLEAKRVARGPTKSKKHVATPDDEQTPTDPFIEEFGSQILMAAIEGFQQKVAKQHQQAVVDYNSGGLSAKQFNEENYREDGELYPTIEDGEMKIVATIKVDNLISRQVRAEKVLKLCQDNLSLQEIASHLDRSERWVKNSLSKFGLHFGPKGARFSPDEVPYGWKDVGGKLEVDTSEQWVLQKVADDLNSKISPKEICASLNKLKIKNRTKGRWSEPLIKKAVRVNRTLKKTFD